MKWSANQRRCEGAGRVHKAAMEDCIRTAHGDPQPASKLSRKGQSTFFYNWFTIQWYLFLVSLDLSRQRGCIPFVESEYPLRPETSYDMCAAPYHSPGTRGDRPHVYGVCFRLFVLPAFPRVVHLIASQTAGVSLSVFATTVRFVRYRQNIRQEVLQSVVI